MICIEKLKQKKILKNKIFQNNIYLKKIINNNQIKSFVNRPIFNQTQYWKINLPTIYYFIKKDLIIIRYKINPHKKKLKLNLKKP